MIDRIIPAIAWLRSYKRRDVKEDITGGVIVAIMLVPQGMPYAMLAGLPLVIGLYASTLPVFVYALFGSSRHLAVGSVAVASLPVLSSCSKLAPPGTAEYIGLALMLAFMVGITQLTLGLLRLGFLTIFFSLSVISGFTSTAVIFIILSQLKLFLGITGAADHSTFHLPRGIIENLETTHSMTLAIGISSIAAKKQSTIDSDKGLQGLGLANIAKSFFSGYPVTCGFSRLNRAFAERPEPQWIVLDMADLSDIDAVAIHTLEHLMDTYGERDIDYSFTDMIGPIRDLVEKAGWTEKYGDKMHYLSVNHALRAIGVMKWQ